MSDAPRIVGDYYDPVGHRYVMDGRQVPSVTQCLKAAGIIDTTFLNNREALERGTRAHKATELMDAMRTYGGGSVIEITEFSVDGIARSTKAAVGHVNAYASFLSDHAPRYTHVEVGLLHATLRFGGRPDRICADLAGEGPAILEIKTGSKAAWHGIQLAAYQMLFPTGSRWVVYLKPNGRYSLERCTNAEDYGRFMQALSDVRAGVHR